MEPTSAEMSSQMIRQLDQLSNPGEAAGANKPGGPGEQGASFEAVMTRVQEQPAAGATAPVNEIGEVGEVDHISEVGQIEPIEAAQHSESTPEIAPVDNVETPSSARMREFLNDLHGDESRLDTMMTRSISGGEMSSQDLLQMQALIYSYSQKVDLASKAVANASGGIKQVMNTQV